MLAIMLAVPQHKLRQGTCSECQRMPAWLQSSKHEARVATHTLMSQEACGHHSLDTMLHHI